jgi:SAM-dependent methyltransferase
MSYHESRFTFDQRREVLWRTLCHAYFQKLVPLDGCVLELGAGYGHFINNIEATRRIAVDIWPGMAEYIKPPVESRIGSVSDLAWVPDRSVDFAFASNLFEHLERAEFLAVLDQLRSKLTAGGTLNILQPNYRYAYKEYFDDYTHVSVYSAAGLCDLLTARGFEIADCQPRFLPLTIKSRAPVFPALIRLYLALPVKPLGKQMLIRARVRDPAAVISRGW